MSSAGRTDRLAGRLLYLCTPDRPDLEDFVAACVEGGVDVVQLREKHLDARPLIARARLSVEICRHYGVPFILNDRPDLALEVGADGVHVGQDDAPARLARSILGEEAIVGISTHRVEDCRAAADEPIDYVSTGPVVPTPTKPGRPGTGLGYLAEAAAIISSWRRPVPAFVTGGVAPENVGGLVEAGARRFVVVRYLTEASDPGGASVRLRSAIEEQLARRGKAAAD